MSGNGAKNSDEHISTAVLTFLKRRKYLETSTDRALKPELVQSSDEMAVRRTIAQETGITNVMSLVTNNSEPSLFEEQYSNLKSFITGANQSYRLELSQILYPMFANIYLEMISKGLATAAHSFFSKFRADFSTERWEELQHLQGITGAERLKSSDIAQGFRRNKFLIKLSKNVFTYFMQYLKSGSRMLLLQMLNQNFCIEVPANKPSKQSSSETETVEIEEGASSKNQKETKHGKIEKEKEGKSENFLALKEAINQVRKGPACLPSVVYYSFVNAYQGLSSACISNDGTLLCGGFEDSAVRVWSLTPKKLVAPLEKTDISKVHLSSDSADDKVETVSTETVTMRGHSGPIYGSCFSPDNKVLLTASEDTTVRLWNLQTYDNAVMYKGHNYPVWDIDISSNGVYFVSGSRDRTARLWHIEYTYPLRIFAGHVADVDGVEFHPNCSYIGTGSVDRTCRMWDIQTGNFVRLFSGHKGTVFTMAFSPDGKYLASAGEDAHIKVWDIASSNMIKELHGHTDTVYSLSFSHDGTLLASGGMDGCVRIWDADKVLKTGNGVVSSVLNSTSSPELAASFSAKANSCIHFVKFFSCNVVYACGTVV